MTSSTSVVPDDPPVVVPTPERPVLEYCLHPGRALRDVIRGLRLVLRAVVTRDLELAVIGRAAACGIPPDIVGGYRDARQR